MLRRDGLCIGGTCLVYRLRKSVLASGVTQHVSSTPLTGIFLVHISHCSHAPHGSRVSGRVSHKNHLISMFHDERFSSFSFTHSRSPFSSPWTIPSGAPCIRTTCAQDPRKEDCGFMATSSLPTGHEPNMLDTSEKFNVHSSVFQYTDLNSIYNLDLVVEATANA